ncbi:MAG: arsenic efflux protein [Clostridia bacterium]|nr:arsenic efflux protein [Clostridia bacterium]
MPEILSHTLLDTLKLIPFLFLAYLLMEFLEHKSGSAAEAQLKRSGKIGPLLGSALGILPQCGFSVAAAGLYTGRVITTGTLVAVFLATSDEMLPILVSEGAPLPLIFKILGLKLLIGIAAGFLIDLVERVIHRKRSIVTEPRIEELCEREHCRCGEHFALSAVRHTLHVTLFVLLFTFLLNLLLHGIGEEKLGTLLTATPVVGNLVAALVGLIPNCASSVVLTEMYLSGILSAGAMLSGLLVNAGIGLAVLFRNNRPVRDSFRILALLFGIGTLTGILIDLLRIFS